MRIKWGRKARELWYKFLWKFSRIVKFYVSLHAILGISLAKYVNTQ